ncbi:MAG TPA: O-methyltransferase [Polyangiaceae bacterium]|nr:O-methyltransferase [Polyangiaceae bacterium]
MSHDQWTAVDRYITDRLVPYDRDLEAALESSAAAGLPEIQVSPNQGKLLFLLAQLQGARAILEVGTLGGYSAIWLARALPPDGRLVTLESDARNAAIARANITRAGLAGRVEIRVGRALDTLPQLLAEKSGPFDVIFLDADKENNPHYFEWALRLARRGSLIVCDNVVRDGSIVDEENENPGVVGTRLLYETMAREARVSATAIQTVGSKGYDGFAVALVTSDP